MARCRYCHRQLTDPESIKHAAGDTCRQRQSRSKQTALEFSTSQIFKDGMSLKEQHMAACRVSFKRGE